MANGDACLAEGCSRVRYNQGITTQYCRIHMNDFPRICLDGNCNQPTLEDQEYCSKHWGEILENESLEFEKQVKHRTDLDNIVISTGGLDCRYNIIDTIMVFDSDTAVFGLGVDAKQTFDSVKELLRERAIEAGGDAVIFCQFEYRNAVRTGIIANAPVFEIFAYGTVVKRE